MSDDCKQYSPNTYEEGFISKPLISSLNFKTDLFSGSRPGRKDVKFKKILRALKQHYKQKLINFHTIVYPSKKDFKSKASKDILIHNNLRETATR